jgi:hypothetical protein
MVQVPEPAVNLMMQLSPLATPEAVTPETVGVQFASDKAAIALGAETSEIAESEESTRTRGRKDEAHRRKMRPAVPILASNFITTSTLSLSLN